MLRKVLAASGSALMLVAAASVADNDSPRARVLSAKLLPTQEVPALSSTGEGRFKAFIDDAAQTIHFELRYRGLEAPPVQAHIHIGQRHVNGGISVFLCGPAPDHDPCPAPEWGFVTVKGVLTPADIIGPVAQGIDPATDEANGFAELVRLLRSGATYANVHSTKFPAGEIRGQIKPEGRR